MLTRVALAVLWLLHFLPRTWLARLGQAIGLALMAFGAERRNVVRSNLRLCFPELDGRKRARLARRHFMAAGRALAETTIAWWSPAAHVQALARIEGHEHLRQALERGPTIVLAPHFVGVDILAIRLSLEHDAISMYSRQKDPLFDRFLVSRRTRFRPIRLASRQDGIKPVVRALRAGLPFFFLPDMDFGPRDAVFVPFFGVPAATVDALPRLAALTGARVVPVVVTQGAPDEGYAIRFFPAWTGYPGGDPLQDSRRMNQFIEEHVRACPEQYYWLHKRFKTRPPGEERFY
ncbi:MAG TPA: lipid A biosynthesis acyltransferase [Burkholderiales bacterium]|jgi:KDO2-lipid IV(A) lauroyltransferase|nr:lipid A biosynthesis acyltransferase [Burkholderiales bacterium]